MQQRPTGPHTMLTGYARIKTRWYPWTMFKHCNYWKLPKRDMNFLGHALEIHGQNTFIIIFKKFRQAKYIWAVWRRSVSPVQPWMRDPYCCSVQAKALNERCKPACFLSLIPRQSICLLLFTRHLPTPQVGRWTSREAHVEYEEWKRIWGGEMKGDNEEGGKGEGAKQTG